MKLSSLTLDCLVRAAFSYNPQQPRDDKGRWAATGRSTNTGHDLWIMGGVSYGATAAAARMTNSEGWDNSDSEYGPFEEELARDLLKDIQSQRVRTTTYYSGHTSRPHLEVGDTLDIPLMSITNSRQTASIYSDTFDHAPQQTAANRTAKVLNEAQKVIDGIRDSGSDISPHAEQTIRDAYLDISARGKGLKRPQHYNPPTTYRFESNKSTPIRVNERVASGRYRVKSIDRSPIPGRVTYDPDTHRYEDAYSETVTLSFVEDLRVGE